VHLSAERVRRGGIDGLANQSGGFSSRARVGGTMLLSFIV
jgi:hypothetical protein